MKTVTIQIGNTDNKLTQQEWSAFCQETGKAVASRTPDVYFYGHSHGGALWQNAAWIISIQASPLNFLRQDLAGLAAKFRQDSIAVTIGDTVFVN